MGEERSEKLILIAYLIQLLYQNKWHNTLKRKESVVQTAISPMFEEAFWFPNRVRKKLMISLAKKRGQDFDA